MIFIVILNLVVDYMIYFDELFQIGVVYWIDDVVFIVGGKGINVVKYVLVFDVDVIVLGFFGGYFGKFVCD